MDKTRRRRGRKKVDYVDIVPSTDLPPLVEGDLRCFLRITLGKIVWGNSTPSRIAPVSPAYVRLRWWGEVSDGTCFRPQRKHDGDVIKTRAQFGIRSGPKQMTAYLNDMGSITFDVLSSPTSMPIGRVQIPNAVALSSSNPIRGFFPVISSSSRKLGELQVSMKFEPLRDAYDEGHDSATDSSISSRSRNASGLGSRLSSRERASSIGSVRSRSSSTGSNKQACGRSRSNSRRSLRRRSASQSSTGNSKHRSRSRSHDSNASQLARQVSFIEHGHTSPQGNGTSTPRGVDAMLEQNGHDLYALGGLNVNKLKDKNDITKAITSSENVPGNLDFDAINDLLQRGKKLRDEITISALSPDIAQEISMHHMPHNAQLPPAQPVLYTPASQTEKTHVSTNLDAKLQTVAATPNKIVLPPQVLTHRIDTEMRLVNLVLQAKGLRDNAVHLSEVSSVASGMESIVSDLEDPLHDESILQQLLYNHTGIPANNGSAIPSQIQVEQAATTTDNEKNHVRSDPWHLTHGTATSKPNAQFSSGTASTHPVDTLSALGKVRLARVTVKAVQMADSFDSDEDISPPLKNASRKRDMYVKVKQSKPPMSASLSAKKKNVGAFFVEYKFPFAQKSNRSTTTTHEITRIVSRKITPGRLVKFEQHNIFPVEFDADLLTRWLTGSIQFTVSHRSPKNKKPVVIGSAVLPLKHVIDGKHFAYSDTIDVFETINDNMNAPPRGSMKVCVELTGDSKDLPVQLSPVKQVEPVKTVNTYTQFLPDDKDMVEEQNCQQRRCPASTRQFYDSTKVQVVSNPSCLVRNCATEAVLPAADILYLYVLLKEARDIPATKSQKCPNPSKCNFPNTYLVCRSFASDDVSKTAVAWNTSNPVFDFSQVIPLKINGQMFSRMRDNYMVVEVWTKVPGPNGMSDKLMGLVKIPLNVFYQSLSDEDVARSVLKSDYPVVAVDGFLPIVDVFTGQERGKLQTLLSLGSKQQTDSLRKMKEFDQKKKSLDCHHLNVNEPVRDEQPGASGPVKHMFEITIRGLHGFKPQDSQVWGETDCFIQYHFPTQRSVQDEDACDEASLDEERVTSSDLAHLQTFRTDATLCLPDPRFGFSHSHVFHPPPSVPVQRILLSTFSGIGKYPGGSVPFEIWSRFYYPNVRDQLLARGFLPVAKLCAMVAMKNGKVSEQKFDVPMEFVEPEESKTSAGDLRLSVIYKCSGTTLESVQPALPFCKSVKLQVAVLRACGLKTAAKIATSLLQDKDLEYRSAVGLDTYAVMKLSFLHDEKPRKTRCVARNFAPDYNHHFDVMCPLITYQDSVSPLCLASLLSSGEIELEIWHKPPSEVSHKTEANPDILLGRVTVPTAELLTRTTGCTSWFPIHTLESLQRKSIITVGGVELSVSFPCRNDLELLLRAAKSVAWKPHPTSDLARLLVTERDGIMKPVDHVDITSDHVTVCVTVTNAWLPMFLLTRAGADSIDKNAHVYLHYKFYDKDSTTSNICQVLSGRGKKSGSKENDSLPVKLVHRKSFLCKPTQPFVWYLREELLEIQVWLTHSRTRRSDRRPLDADKLLGTVQIEMSSVLAAGLYKQQHISGSYPLFKAGADDLGEACIRVYISVNPGDHTKPCDVESEDDTFATLSSSSDVPDEDADNARLPEQPPPPQSDSPLVFSAVVSVERAMHLPSISPLEHTVSSENEASSTVYPGCYVSYQVGETTSSETVTTKIVARSSCPVWGDSKEVKLSRSLLENNGGNLLFRVWHRGIAPNTDGACDQSFANDRMIGFATVDISTLRAGFNAVNGWYNIIDIHGTCQGQIKVAIAPFTPSSLLSATISSAGATQQNIADPGATRQGAFHFVPLLTPVQTPSGSMYFPGVCSEQTVGTTCKITTSSNSAALPAASYTQSFGATHPTSSFYSALKIPFRSSVGYDQQQACLLQTLQRQMKELDQIKENFQQKNFGLDSGPDFRHSLETEVLKSLSAAPVVTFEADAPVMSAAVSAPYTSEPFPHQPPAQQEQLFANVTTARSMSRQSAVHMSLFKTDKEVYDDGAALSDTELSGIEFVRPKNLNQEELNVDIEAAVALAASGIVDDTDDIRSSLQVTQSSSELNNTSLWLSASASHADEPSREPHQENDDDKRDSSDEKINRSDSLSRRLFSEEDASDEEDQDERGSDESPVQPVDSGSAIDSNPNPDIIIITPDENAGSVHQSQETELALLEVQEQLEVQDVLRESDDDDRDFMESAESRDVRGKEIDEEENEQDPLQYDEELQDDVLDSQLSSPRSTSEKKDSEALSISDGKSASSTLSGNSANEDEKDEQNEQVTPEKSDAFAAGNGGELKESSPDAIAPHPSGKSAALPRFFPPSKDLIASMRSLQAITTDQQTKFTNQRSSDDVAQQPDSPTGRRTRKRPAKPSSFTPEQTNRLARIFNTKYTSS